MDADHGVPDPGVRGQRGLDLPELDPLTPDLDLVVSAAQELQGSGGVLSDEVPGPVEPGTVVEGAGHEPFRGAAGLVVVSPGQLDTGEVELTGDTGGHRAQRGVQDVGGGVPHREPDEDPFGAHRAGPVGDVHGGFGRAVEVVHGGVR